MCVLYRVHGVALCDLHTAINPLRSWRSQRRGFMCRRGALRETCKSKGKCLPHDTSIGNRSITCDILPDYLAIIA